MFDFEHLRKNNFTYFQHMRRAAASSTLMFRAAILGLIHSVFPFIFYDSMTEASERILQSHKKKESPKE